MMVSVPCAILTGVEGQPVTVEVHIGTGLPGFGVVGALDSTCRETRDRLRAAILESGLQWPSGAITVNVVPAGLGRLGSGLDLAIAVGIIAAHYQLYDERMATLGFVGELGLDGTLRPAAGMAAMTEAVTVPEVVVPASSSTDVHTAGGHHVRPVATLRELAEILAGRRRWPEPPAPPPDAAAPAGDEGLEASWAAIGRSPALRLAAMIAAGGGHNLLLIGSGASTVARAVAGLLPDLAPDQAREVARVHSAAGLPLPPDGLVRRPPLRQLHWTASVSSVIGGDGRELRPGEASLAHRGVLFFDDLAEFPKAVLDQLRAPMDTGAVRVSRGDTSVVLPARFQLVAAVQRCPCQATDPAACSCSDHALARYARRVPGPLLDRFDLAPNGPLRGVIGDRIAGGSTTAVRRRVAVARERAQARGVAASVDLDPQQLYELTPMSKNAYDLMRDTVRAGHLTGRGHAATWRVALTIADLAGATLPLSREHVALALALRTNRLAVGTTEATDPRQRRRP